MGENENLQRNPVQENQQDGNSLPLVEILTVLWSLGIFLLWFATAFVVWTDMVPVWFKEVLVSKKVLKTYIYVFCGGGIGGSLFCLRVLYKYISRRQFYVHWLPWYIVRPFTCAGMGLMLVFLMDSGIILLSNSPGTTTANNKFYVAIAFLAGYGHHEVIKKIEQLNRTLFAYDDNEGKV